MKTLVYPLLRSSLLFGLIFAFAACSRGKDGDPSPDEKGATLTSSEEVSKVMVVVGRKLEQTNPPVENGTG